MNRVVSNTIGAICWGLTLIIYLINPTNAFFDSGWFIGMLIFLVFFYSLVNALEAHKNVIKEDTN